MSVRAAPAGPRRAVESESALGTPPHRSSAWWWVRSVAAWLFLMIMVALLLATVVVPRVSGGQAYTVLTNSMKPDLPPGTLIIIRPIAAGQLAVGDVITYQLESGKPAVVTHRVVSVAYEADGEQSVRTRGDNNAAADQKPVRDVQVRGKLWYSIPWVGHVNSWVSGQRRSLILVVVVSGLLIYAAAMFISAARDRRRHHVAS